MPAYLIGKDSVARRLASAKLFDSSTEIALQSYLLPVMSDEG
jgi:hypothetical protein